ncbi:hypothetical protein [Serratia sp. 14-2641]|uniref:hypothetical protein n=1 Tax=Serratia sp. 14-2641 TaxID=1841657 RepID=UPI00080FB506|nr:hypothetical protein [Serratia sp. 14-2641]OCJ37340.1 hypothetical protein A6U95_24830 [Serratia sp. 14-2641]
MAINKYGKLNRVMESMIDWCGGHTQFFVMAVIIGVGMMSIVLSILKADPILILASLLLTPVFATIGRKMIP